MTDEVQKPEAATQPEGAAPQGQAPAGPELTINDLNAFLESVAPANKGQ